MQAREVASPGFYWLFDPGGEPVVVQVVQGEGPGLTVLFTGRADEDMLEDLSGQFVGPLFPPIA